VLDEELDTRQGKNTYLFELADIDLLEDDTTGVASEKPVDNLLSLLLEELEVDVCQSELHALTSKDSSSSESDSRSEEKETLRESASGCVPEVIHEGDEGRRREGGRN